MLDPDHLGKGLVLQLFSILQQHLSLVEQQQQFQGKALTNTIIQS